MLYRAHRHHLTIVAISVFELRPRRTVPSVDMATLAISNTLRQTRLPYH